MSSTDKEVFVRFASACRRGLEALAGRQSSLFQTFPRGACGPASELLGRLLQERLGLAGEYVCASDHPNLPSADQSHAWVEVAGNIIDITHDQFDGTDVAGWVIPSNSTWHGQFRRVDRRASFCLPAHWPLYPYDGYKAMASELNKLTP